MLCGLASQTESQGNLTATHMSGMFIDPSVPKKLSLKAIVYPPSVLLSMVWNWRVLGKEAISGKFTQYKNNNTILAATFDGERTSDTDDGGAFN